MALVIFIVQVELTVDSMIKGVVLGCVTHAANISKAISVSSTLNGLVSRTILRPVVLVTFNWCDLVGSKASMWNLLLTVENEHFLIQVLLIVSYVAIIGG